MLRTDVDNGDVIRVTRMLPPGVVKRVAASAGNDALRHGRKVISQAVRQEVNLKAGDVKREIKVDRASRTTAAGALKIDRRSIPLSDFGAKKLKRGVSVKVRRKGGREKLRHAFFVGRYDNRLFERERQGGGYAPRGPLDQLAGPTVVGVAAGAPGLLNRETRSMTLVFRTRFRSKLDYELEKRTR